MAKKPKYKEKLPLLVKLSIFLLFFFAISLLGMISVAVYMNFFSGEPFQKNIQWFLNLFFYFLLSLFVIMTSVGLILRDKISRIIAILFFFIISFLNIGADIFSFEMPLSILRIFFWGGHFALGLYLFLSKKVKYLFLDKI